MAGYAMKQSDWLWLRCIDTEIQSQYVSAYVGSSKLVALCRIQFFNYGKTLLRSSLDRGPWWDRLVTIPDNEPSDSDPATSKPVQRPSEVSFEELSKGRKEVVIEHEGKLYRLRLTRKGGLILN